MDSAQQLAQGRKLLGSIKGKKISTEERCDLAIELAALMLDAANQTQSRGELRLQAELAAMMDDETGKVFTTSLTDQCFRTDRSVRVANQINFLLDKFGIPRFLSWTKRVPLRLFRSLSSWVPGLLVPLTTMMLRNEMSRVILPGEAAELKKHMARRRKQGVRLNLNHLGEAILGEEEALRRLQVYLDDLCKPDVEYVSIKVTTIYSQINLLAWDQTMEVLADRMRQLYRAASQHEFVRADGTRSPKFVNLDMEEYRDLQLTVEVFCKVLNEEEFKQHSAGIVLQSYLPDAYPAQKLLTDWAMQRVADGGAPIKIRIVKGANLAMEQVEASEKGWPQTPYLIKADVDANYKHMVTYGCQPEHAKAAHLGIASHNLFDIAYSMLLRVENGVEEEVCFEMLEGMADHLRRIVQLLAGDMLLYCPVATKEEFQNAIAYLIRRLDENTAPENFLRHQFDMQKGSKSWNEQKDLFITAVASVETVSFSSRRQQNRLKESAELSENAPFDNEPDTDWALSENRKWVSSIIEEWKDKKHGTIPLVINGQELISESTVGGYDPSCPGTPFYHYTLAEWHHIDQALDCAKQAESSWAARSGEERAELVRRAAGLLRSRRGDFIGAMMADGGKTAEQSDPEISEAIDFCEYYWRSLLEHQEMEGVSWKPKGTVLVTPPWNFPYAIPCGGVVAALVAGNSVLFKPAPETVLVGWLLANVLWEAGIPKDVLQFISCEDEPVGTRLIKDDRVNCVILTGATATAEHFLRVRPRLDLMAETGGKNALIVTEMADRDLAVKDAIYSAFGHAGQKCSAASLLICEANVFDDPNFRRQLRDAAASLKVGSAWDPSTKVNPLIHTPSENLERGLTRLDDGEEWLLQPKQDAQNPQLWSPGIRWGVKEGNFTQKNELFGPVLSVMRADNLEHAVKLANATDYGLTSGIHSLDEREREYWAEHIEAGNCYINRGTTGAIVQRQPFGGCKKSNFGRGSKAGGPNYLSQLMVPEETALPKEFTSYQGAVEKLGELLKKESMAPEQWNRWKKAIGHYAYCFENHFSEEKDVSQIVGQDNILRYVPHSRIVLRLQSEDKLLDRYLACAAALTCGTWLEVSCEEEVHWGDLPNVQVVRESEEELCLRIQTGAVKRLRYLSEPPLQVLECIVGTLCRVACDPVHVHGEVELLHYLREVSISFDYHRYGNLGERENETRRVID